MKISEADFELLNALIDEELSLTQKQKLYRRLETEDDLQQVYISLHQLKKSVASTYTNSLAPITKKQHLDARKLANFAHDVGSVFLSINKPLMVTLSLIMVMFIYSIPQETKPQLIAQNFSAIELLHQQLSKKEIDVIPKNIYAMEDVANFSPDITPDLSLSNLFMVLQYRDSNSAKVLHYRGVNGCKLTLKIQKKYPLYTTNSKASNAQQYHWEADGKAYQIIASGMDQSRFKGIAAYVEQVSLSFGSPEFLQMAMVRSSRKAKPCV